MSASSAPPFADIDAASRRLETVGYVADDEISTAVYLATALEKPLLVEGPAGVGKTELAKALANALDRPLIRLQCYEGLDESKVLYEWKYAKQLLYTQMLRDEIQQIVGDAPDLNSAVDRIAEHQDAFFSDRFLEPRPLLRAVRSSEPAVLLIDEVDRAEEELEAFFLEVLAEFQVTIPELGTLTCQHRPVCVLTSNDTRELSDALRRRCLHLYLDFPSPDREAQIIRTHLPDIDDQLAQSVAGFLAGLRQLELKKLPSVSETLDWARSLLLLCARRLDRDTVERTLNVLVKHRGDREVASERLGKLLATDG